MVSYLYCRPLRGTDDTKPRTYEIRRYAIIRECKKSFVLDAKYEILSHHDYKTWYLPAIYDALGNYPDERVKPNQMRVMIQEMSAGEWIMRGELRFLRKMNDEWTSPKSKPQKEPWSWEEYYKRQAEERKQQQEQIDAKLDELLGRLRPSVDFQYFGFRTKPSVAEFKKAHRVKAMQLHPDRGGSAAEFAAMQAKAEQCLTSLGVSTKKRVHAS